MLERLLGLAPVPVPPHVFEVDTTALRYGAFTRRGGEWEVLAWAEAELQAETFQAGPLGGPLRGRESFDRALDEVLTRAPTPPTEASLVMPDRWLRLLFTELEEQLGPLPADEILRFKLKKLVPFRVEDLRLRGTAVPGFPGSPGGSRLLLAFAIDQLVGDLETAFAARGVRVGQVASRSLYLVSLLAAGAAGGLLLVNLETDGYCLSYLGGGVPYVVRYRTLHVDDAAHAANVAQDLRILLGFLEEHLPEHGIAEAVVCGPAEEAASWVELLRDRFTLPARQLGAADLALASASATATGAASHRLAPLLAAATREVA